ncbi:integrase-like protein [Dysgonomonas alginatilytica]|uniref:Integrase-like protein n=1 Tax=Dysgonomonas alginatilytica TaxID=1605892 RepID=A0A2V3PK78_9BACT|nr:site-specific integrase [Dysgonomonas alginatilytica]PXV61215.1 integrase-like protein [Dysgonomonas alginatilytica]
MAGLEPKYTIREPNSIEPTYIRVNIRYKYKELKVDTGDKIIPILWDKDNQRPTTDRKTLRNLHPLVLKELQYISLHLDEIDYFIRDLVLDLKRDKTISLEIIKDKLSEFLGRKKEDEPIPPAIITDYYDNLIERMSNGTFLTDKGTVYTPGTIKMHSVCKNQIASFGDIWGQLAFDSVSNDFYTKFITYCHSKNYKQNTIGRAIKSLKFVMKVAYKESFHTNEIFKDEDFKANMEDVDNIYLRVDELKAMYDLDLSNDKVRERARDLFLIGCYTGQRFSDYSRFRPEHIKSTSNGTKVIDIVTKKTKQRVIIPFLFPELDILLKKYNYHSPKAYEQDLNEQIKEVGKRAGITGDIIIAEKKGGKMIETLYKKHDLIKTHTARRSCATNLFKMGYVPLEIMKITGHTSEATFLKYIKVSKEENAEIMMSKINEKENDKRSE